MGFVKRDYGYTGNQIEAELLGEVAEPKRISFEYWKNNYDKFRMSKGEMYRLVEANQPEGSEPTDAEADFAYQVQCAIAEILTAQGQEIFERAGKKDLFKGISYDQVKFYTAVGSPMDYALGVDGYFKIYLDDISYIEVTLDASGWQKPEYKADQLIIYEGIDSKTESAKWKDFISSEALAVVQWFKYKLEKNEIKRAR